MTPEQYFQKYPGANGVWQVGTDLFHERYKASASAHSQRTGQPLQKVNRADLERKAKPAAAKATEQKDADSHATE